VWDADEEACFCGNGYIRSIGAGGVRSCSCDEKVANVIDGECTCNPPWVPDTNGIANCDCPNWFVAPGGECIDPKCTDPCDADTESLDAACECVVCKHAVPKFYYKRASPYTCEVACDTTQTTKDACKKLGLLPRTDDLCECMCHGEDVLDRASNTCSASTTGSV
jgi:hypothetical protein